MKHFLFTLAGVLFFLTSFAQQEKYSRVRVLLDTKEHTMMQLSRLGVAVDHGDYRKGQYFISDFSATEIKAIKDAGFKTEVQIDDVSKYYRDQNDKPGNTQKKTSGVPCDTASLPGVDIPAHFHSGSYAGGHFTYTEMLDILDSMHFYYPNLINTRQQVGSFTTIEGRPIYWVRISNNPTVDQPAKPQILYNAVHHAREPGSLTSTIFYMWHLLENYNTDPQVKAIVDNMELYFIPCVNPDGYIYNITTNPFGGGMWRKNRRNNGNGSFGVDLNRNYGYLWGYDNIGSSNAGSSDVYRGSGPFSEPETQAVKWFTEQHHFSMAMNYHTYNNELLSPFGHVELAYPPDSLEFSAFSVLMTKNNFYRYGTCYQCLGYVSNGGSDDWMYAEQNTKNKIFAFTPEIGEVQYGFYPPSTEIIPDCKRNLHANINAAALVLPYAKISTADPNILTSASGYIHYSLQRLGIAPGGTYTVSVQPLDNWITLPSAPQVHTNLSLLQNVTDSFSYTLASGINNNQNVRYLLKVNNGYYDIADTIEFYYGKNYAIAAPGMSSFANWTSFDWSISTAYAHTGPSSFKSSPGPGYYPDNSTVQLELKDEIDLVHSLNAYLQFYARWDIEPKYDYLTVEATEAGASNWTPLCGRFTKPGDYSQPLIAPVYDDHQYDWFLEQMDLRGYLGKKINIRFTLQSDAGASYDGFYFDDLQVTSVEAFPGSVGRVEKGSGLSVYPNPASDKLTIRLDGAPAATAGLYDGLGRLVKNITLSGEVTVVDIAVLPSGLYYLKAFTGGQPLQVQKVQVLK